MPSLSALALSRRRGRDRSWLRAAGVEDAWVRVRSPHFEVLSDAGEAPAREAARRLERLRVVLRRLFPAGEDVARPITVLLIEDQARFSSLIPRERAAGTTRSAASSRAGDERDYAVLHLSPLQARPFEAVGARVRPPRPEQLPAGAAGVGGRGTGGPRLSDAVLEGDEARLGAARPDYEDALRARSRPGRSERSSPSRYDSPEYRGHGDGELLYARAWALVRWVVHRHGLDGAPLVPRDHRRRRRSRRPRSSTASAASPAPRPRSSTSRRRRSSESPWATSPDPRPRDGRPDDRRRRAAPRRPAPPRRATPAAARRRFERGPRGRPGPRRRPDEPRAASWSGRESGRRAASSWRRSLAADPDDPAALLRLARLEVGQALHGGSRARPPRPRHGSWPRSRRPWPGPRS